MNKIKLFFTCSLLFLLSCKLAIGMNIDIPAIRAGKAKLTGKIITPDGINKDSVSVTIGVPHPISGELVQYEAIVDRSGKFSIDFDVETDTTLIGLYASINPSESLLIKVISNDLTNIDIAYNSNLNIKNAAITPAMNQNDMRWSMQVLYKMIDYRPVGEYKAQYNKSVDEFLNYAKNAVSNRLGIFLDNDTLLSKEFKGIVAKEFRLFMYNAHVLDYEEEMIHNYRNATGNMTDKPEIQKIDKSYFRFLKDFDLNDPQYLQSFTFHEFQKAILQNEVLGLPEIGESDIPTWLASVKIILADLVGFDHGPYYDILAANAYSRQLNEEVRPLSEKQKEYIAQYWKNGEIAKILFRKNEKIVELNKVKSPAVINDIQSVPEDKVIETIISKYKDKVILIDLWATWCGPCLEAIKQFRETKGDFADKDVVFVYLTNGSSPKKLWEEKIKGIGDQHYYLTAAQWKYMMEHFEFEGIPSYLLYNKEGKLMNKFTGFPGNDAVKDMINGLLK